MEKGRAQIWKGKWKIASLDITECWIRKTVAIQMSDIDQEENITQR